MLRSLFPDAIIPVSSGPMRPTLGAMPDSPTAPATGESHGTPAVTELPKNDLHIGSPKSS
jgi:hypothetical protein